MFLFWILCESPGCKKNPIECLTQLTPPNGDPVTITQNSLKNSIESNASLRYDNLLPVVCCDICHALIDPAKQLLHISRHERDKNLRKRSRNNSTNVQNVNDSGNRNTDNIICLLSPSPAKTIASSSPRGPLAVTPPRSDVKPKNGYSFTDLFQGSFNEGASVEKLIQKHGTISIEEIENLINIVEEGEKD